MTTYKLIAVKKSPSQVGFTRELFWANTCNLSLNINKVKERTSTTSLRFFKINYVQTALKERLLECNSYDAKLHHIGFAKRCAISCLGDGIIRWAFIDRV